MEIAPEHKNKIIKSLEGVGRVKAVGYLPRSTITNILGQDESSMLLSYEERGLKVRIFEPDSCCIKSGAFVVYSREMVQNIINKHLNLIAAMGWKPIVCGVITQIMTTWFDPADKICPVIAELYGEQC